MDSPSSSLSPSPNCHICGQPGQGNHFGAWSCRACSAFFRRAILGNFKRLKCRKMIGICEANKEGRFNCKRCRLQKCYEAGMHASKFQFDRDLMSSTEKASRKRRMLTTIPYSMENYLGRPTFIFSCEPDLATSHRTLIDVQCLIDHASEFFFTNNYSRRENCLIGKSTLHRLSHALELSRQPSKETPIVSTKIGKDDFMMFWENKILASAKWLTYCDEFQKFPLQTKIDFLKAVWFVWMKADKIGKVAEEFINSQEINPIAHVMNNWYVDMEKLEFETTWMSNYTAEQLKYFLDKPCRAYQCRIQNPLLELRAKSQEITYIICIVSFRYAVKTNPGIIAELAEKLMDKLADDLHNFYFEEWKMSNYASRLAQLLKIVQLVEREIYEQKQRAEIARLFDVFTFEFSHPEMFIGI